MDRRDFFRTLAAVPFLMPHLRDSAGFKPEGLHIISSSPQEFLPPLLGALISRFRPSDTSFAFLTPHPDKPALEHVLVRQGWNPAPSVHRAHAWISFRPLRPEQAPSFAFSRGGRILDVRKHRLRALWEKMQAAEKTSGCLTAITLRPHLAGDASGTGIRVYREGRLLETLRLQEDREKSYRVRGGVIVLRIQLSQARIISASCRHQVCVSTAPISWSGERILCAPNHFMIAALGSSPVDTVIG